VFVVTGLVGEACPQPFARSWGIAARGQLRDERFNGFRSCLEVGIERGLVLEIIRDRPVYLGEGHRRELPSDLLGVGPALIRFDHRVEGNAGVPDADRSLSVKA
jgi:hypothetical protein